MTEKYTHLSVESLARKHQLFSSLSDMMGMEPATVARELPKPPLPTEVMDTPLLVNGEVASFFLVTDRRRAGGQWHSYYSVRARAGTGRQAAKWHLCSLGPDLPMALVDGFRAELAQESGRRRHLVLAGAKVMPPVCEEHQLMKAPFGW